MIEIDLVRHGRTVFNEERRVQGVADSELTPNGRAQAAALGRGLQVAGKTYGQIYSSDLKRAYDTATLTAAELTDAPSVRQDPGLREENYGRFESWPVDDYARTVLGVPNFKAAIATGRYTLESIADKTFATNAGEDPAVTESAAMVVARIDATLRRIAQRAEHTNAMRTLVVAHGTALLMWLAFAGKGEPGAESLKNCSVTNIYYDQGVFTIGDVNDTTFLESGIAAGRKADK
ncbi:histidine phosphatase family protein [Lacticaseibacillus pabuli]|uniref:Histidine phosphatase family protein n=1 Tax=Lacticaseibacillus pabuli TaxID=3025672 RepID=A0ABY7WQJ4_9LACO|nr:histidine phosphatase family protein [Lacticaseibacillus sp. KACC 23028]WDF82452.1 histidine phosphatase family protein [Lacticaseibacillus sp. KACC 23028]